jgi:NTP pyrophosphatase (non-canonical NTP hydrolase)
VDLQQAAAVLYLHRHRLSPDMLRTIQDLWVCASAARYGGPFETGWADDPDAYSEHDVRECEADDGAELADTIGASAETTPPVNLREIARQLERDLRSNRCPGITDASQLDVQALCVAEKAGELAGAYRRYAGRARRAGTLRELEGEVADVLIVTAVFAVFAERAGIDIDAAACKLAVIYSRGWREVRHE